jgi:uncharacterized membrane protein
MLLVGVYEVPILASLSVIATLLVGSIVASFLRRRNCRNVVRNVVRNLGRLTARG